MIVCVHSLQKRNAAQSARRLCGREIVIALHTHTAESCMLLIFWIIHQHTRLTANSGSRKTSLLFLYFSSRVCRELTRPMQTQCEWNSSVRALHGGYILLTRAHIWLSNEPDRLRQFSQWSGALADFLEQSVSRQIRENAQKNPRRCAHHIFWWQKITQVFTYSRHAPPQMYEIRTKDSRKIATRTREL